MEKRSISSHYYHKQYILLKLNLKTSTEKLVHYIRQPLNIIHRSSQSVSNAGCNRGFCESNDACRLAPMPMYSNCFASFSYSFSNFFFRAKASRSFFCGKKINSNKHNGIYKNSYPSIIDFLHKLHFLILSYCKVEKYQTHNPSYQGYTQVDINFPPY